jgi:hypothetical protein
MKRKQILIICFALLLAITLGFTVAWVVAYAGYENDVQSGNGIHRG